MQPLFLITDHLFLCCDQQCVDTCCICFYLKWFGIVVCPHVCAAGRHPWRPGVREKPKSKQVYSVQRQHKWAEAAGSTVCITGAGSLETGFACSIRRTDGARPSAPTGWVGWHPARSFARTDSAVGVAAASPRELAVRGVLCAACESVDCTYSHFTYSLFFII
jgi:hypothetical protein